MAGFNREQQQILATLARFQRKALKLNEMESFTLFKKKHILGLIRILRLSILVNSQRHEELPPELNLSIQDDAWHLTCEDENWLENNLLLHADLQTEQQYWDQIGWELVF